MGAIDMPTTTADLSRWILVDLKTPPLLTVSDWADQYRRLPTKGAAEPGQWRTDRVPFLREIMDCLSDADPARRVVFVKSAQVGGTECGLNWVGWQIATQKSPMLCVQPTLEMAERWSKQRLAAMIEETHTLRDKIRPARERDSGNTTLLKEYPGGVLIIAGANSAAGLRSMPAARLFLDEVDAYPIELEGEGDPIKLAEARTATFTRRKVFLVSTPTIESLSRIWREWLNSDMRRYWVPCPDCGEYQVLKWDQMQWPDDDPLAARYACEHCGSLIDEHHKTDMLAAGEWRPDHPERKVPGFHISGLYTPIGLGLTWGELAEEWLLAKKDAAKLKTFTNIRLGECYADPDERLDWEEIKARAGGYEVRDVPPGCLLITAGVDVQRDRWALCIVGHGDGPVMWVLDYVEIPGDPTRIEDWQKVDDYIKTPLRNTRGIDMRVERCAIDAGYLTDEVLQYVRLKGRGVYFAIKGASTSGRTIIGRPSKVDYNWRGQTIKRGAEIWVLGVDTAKHTLHARLAADRKRLPEDRQVRFPDNLDESYYSQLTAEVWDSIKRKWVKIRQRNEALDTTLYGLAAAMHPLIRVQNFKAPQWEKRRAAYEPEGDLFNPPPPTPKPDPLAAVTPPAPAPKNRIKRLGRGIGWKK